MGMDQQHPALQDFSVISKTLYYSGYILLLAGLIYSTFVDVGIGIQSIVILDISAYVAFGTLHTLYALRRISRAQSLLLALLAAMVVFFLSGVFSADSLEYAGHFEGNIMITLLLAGLFASVLGITVNRYAAIIVGLAAIAYLHYMALTHNNAYLKEQFILIALILAGNLLMVFFYRQAMDNLLARLRQAMDELRGQNYDLQVLKEKAEGQNAVNHPFVVFGKNTSGLIHDLKNDVNVLSIRTQVLDMKFKRQRPLDAEDVEELQKAVKRLIGRIEMVKFVANAQQGQAMESLKVHTLLEAAIYPFRITERFRNRINFQIPFKVEAAIYSSRFHLLRILENLVQNSCEAIIDHAYQQGQETGFAGTVALDVHDEGENIAFVVEDDGPGITGCFDCQSADCRDCVSFAVGKTTKSYGSGYGMTNVFTLVSEIGGTIRIASQSGQGTRITLNIPRDLRVKEQA